MNIDLSFLVDTRSGDCTRCFGVGEIEHYDAVTCSDRRCSKCAGTGAPLGLLGRMLVKFLIELEKRNIIKVFTTEGWTKVTKEPEPDDE